jgi:OOP family OmpA-OmpF porin
MNKLVNHLALALLTFGLILWVVPAHAQFGKLKDKIKQKTTDRVEKKVDQALEQEPSDSTQAPPKQAQAGQESPQPAVQSQGGTATAEDMTLYTKYDFVPGDKVLFYDDFSADEVGEFPSRWGLVQGVFEVAKQGNANFVMCSDEGIIFPRLAPGPLPPKYTVELELYAKGPGRRGHWYFIEWLDADERVIGEFTLQDNHSTVLRINGRELASKELPAELGAGIHAMRIMATQSTIKCYVDQERVANVPAVEGFAPVRMRVHMDPWTDEEGNPMLMRSFRFAEGGKTLKQQLDETGRIITHGILFDVASAKIKAESHKTLADIGQLLTDSPGLALSIEGHTDSDGTEESNLTLSQGRANAVRSYLAETYKIDGARLTAKGWGESKPIDANDTPEGKANNRRVELVKQ